MVEHIYSPSTQEVKAGGTDVKVILILSYTEIYMQP